MDMFTLTQKEIQDAKIYDTSKHEIIRKYLFNFFKKKFSLFNDQQNKVECCNHGLEKYTIEKYDYSTSLPGSCLGNTFADWQNVFSIHTKARFDCGREFILGYFFNFRYGDLISIIKQLDDMDDSDFLKGKKFDDNNQIGIMTGFMRNNFADHNIGF